jgi:hypothetical protein
LIAVACIVLLFILSTNLYKTTVGSKQKTQANEILKQVGDKINSLAANETMVLAGPKGWFLEKRGDDRICVVCNKTAEGVCGETYDINQATCVSIKQGLDVQFQKSEIEIYIAELSLKKTAEGENERVIVS